MTACPETIRLIMAQANGGVFANRLIGMAGLKTRSIGGIFGPSPAPDPTEALPLEQGRNEYGIDLAAAARARRCFRRQFQCGRALTGPGRAAFLTAAAQVHVSRRALPLCGDAFLARLPDPVFQHSGDPSGDFSDAIRVDRRNQNRIAALRDQVLWPLHSALATLLASARRPMIIGVTESGGTSAMAARADVVLAMGTRLQDSTAGSWAALSQDIRPITLTSPGLTPASARRRPWSRMPGLGLRGRGPRLGTIPPPETGRPRHRREAHGKASNPPAYRSNSHAQAASVAKAPRDPRHRIVVAAGGLRAKMGASRRRLGIGPVGLGLGRSCAGDKIAGGWRVRIALFEGEPDRDAIAVVGDVSYLLMNSDPPSAAPTGWKPVAMALNSGGVAIAHKLQDIAVNERLHNLIAACPMAPEPPGRDVAAQARSMRAIAEPVAGLDEAGQALTRATVGQAAAVVVRTFDPRKGRTRQDCAWRVTDKPDGSDNVGDHDAHLGQEAEPGRLRGEV